MTSPFWQRWLRTDVGARRQGLCLQMMEDRALPSGSMLADINPGSASANPSAVVTIGSTSYFVAVDGAHGTELWTTDGTAAGTVLVKDVRSGSTSSAPRILATVGGMLFFSADDGVHGTELWTTDGTTAGTVLVKDINPGPGASNPDGRVRAWGGPMFFAADDGAHGFELWKSDGTAAGTALVKDINPGPGSSFNGYVGNDFAELGGALFFKADDEAHGTELWKTDGTAAGTVLVEDINPGTTQYQWGTSVNSSSPGGFTLFNGALFFSAYTEDHGGELWKTDGTPAGTALVADVETGWSNNPYPYSFPLSSSPGDLTVMGETLFFSAGSPYSGRELWRSDGTTAGTVLVADINPGVYPGYFAYGSDPGYLTAVNGILFFSADDGGEPGRELWRSDGTTAGTALVKDIYPGWGVDPNTGEAIPNASNPAGLTTVNGLLYFSAQADTGTELWQSDGTVAGTALVADINPGSASAAPGGLTAVNGTLYFSADDGAHGTELWALEAGPAPPPGVTIVDVTLQEGNAGSTSALFTVQLSGASTEPTTVHYSTADGTATAGSDYQATSGTLTFAPGETTKTIPVPVHGDHSAEANEWFEVNLDQATNGTIFDGRAIGTIFEDEPRITIDDVSRSEGHAGQSAFAFTVRLSNVYDVPVAVDFATADAAAQAGTDYTAAAGTLTFAPGETERTITVLVNGDRGSEPDEAFFVNLSGAANATILDGLAAGTIRDDEPRVSVSDVTTAEGRRNKTTLFTFTVTLSAAYDKPVTMSFQTANGTATTGDTDYVAKSGTLTFAPGETTKTISIVVKGDSKREADETFYLDLFGLSSNALFTKNRGIGTILNDD
jgi:ELWxxDGT repeat protein